MSYVAPSTILRILKGVPLESTYENTVFWDTAKTTPDTWVTQAEKFAEYTKPNVTDTDGTVYSFVLYNLTYQRRERNSIKVGIPADLLLDCNYMMFKNDRFGSKWFYAFITDAEYISEKVTKLTYEIDVLQTWFFDYAPNACYVERSHSLTDKIGDNLIEEGVELGDYFFESSNYTTPDVIEQLKGVGYYICAPWVANKSLETGEWTITKKDTGGTFSAVWSGVYINRFESPQEAEDAIAAATSTLGDQSKNIVALYIAPAGAYKILEDPPYAWYLKSVDNDTSGYDDYTIHNNKLFTYPYRGLLVKNAYGDSHIYRYEYFSGAGGTGLNFECQFEAICDPTPTGTIYLVPVNYKQGLNSPYTDFNWYESISSGNYPLLAFTVDSYQSYLAQSAGVQVWDAIKSAWGADSGKVTAGGGVASAIGSAIGSVVGGIASIISGNTVGGVLSGVGGVANSLAENYKAVNMPNSTQGTSGSKQLNYIFDVGTFQFLKFKIQKQYAMRIDSFFDLYGYADKTVKVPPRHNRSLWTYTKTKNCTVNGSLPVDDERRICDLYDAGIRWWTNMDNIGNYSLAEQNTPLG